MLIRENIETYKEESKHHHPMAHTAKGKAGGAVEGHVFWVRIFVLPLGPALKFSVTQFPLLQDGDNSSHHHGKTAGIRG